MKEILFLLPLLASVCVYGYGSSGGYGSSSGFGNFGGFGNSQNNGNSRSNSNYGNVKSKLRPLSFITGGSLSSPSSVSNSNYRGQFLSAAIQSTHQVRYVDVPIKPLVVQPSTIQISSRAVPLMLLFKSASSQLNIRQVHFGSQGSTQKSTSEDEPHRLVQTIKKPVIQEITEIISPHRRITQRINPVQEEVQTLIARSKTEEAPAPIVTHVATAVPIQVANPVETVVETPVVTPVETIVAAPEVTRVEAFEEAPIAAPVVTAVPVSFVSQVNTQLAAPIRARVSNEEFSPLRAHFRAQAAKHRFTDFRRIKPATQSAQISRVKVESDPPSVESVVNTLKPADREALDADLEATIRALQSQLLKNKDSQPAESVLNEQRVSEDAKSSESIAPEPKDVEPINSESKSPESTNLESTTIESISPESKAPEPIAPESKAPESISPESNAPESIAPESKAYPPVKTHARPIN